MTRIFSVITRTLILLGGMYCFILEQSNTISFRVMMCVFIACMLLLHIVDKYILKTNTIFDEIKQVINNAFDIFIK